MPIFGVFKRMALGGLGALGLATAAPALPAHAQSYNDQYAGPGGGELTVTAPRRYGIDRFTGEPVVRLSRAVYFGDLDLRSDWGVRELHARVVRAAVDVCRDLDAQPGLIPEDTDDCVRPAVIDAMAEAPAPGYLRYRYEYVGY